MYEMRSSYISTGTILQHGGTDGHNFANCYLLPRQVIFLLSSNSPRFGLGINMGTNNGGGLGRTRQATGFGKIVTWIFGELM